MKRVKRMKKPVLKNKVLREKCERGNKEALELIDFMERLYEKQENCPAEFTDIINDNFWELI